MNFFQDWPTNMSHQGLLPTKPSHWPQHPNTAAFEAGRGLGNTKGGNWRDGNYGTIEMISFSWYFFSGYKSETRSFWLLVLETLEGTWSHCKRTEKFWWGEWEGRENSENISERNKDDEETESPKPCEDVRFSFYSFMEGKFLVVGTALMMTSILTTLSWSVLSIALWRITLKNTKLAEGK